MVFLEVAGRQVLSIRNIDYFLLQFDDKGRIDKKEWEKGLRLGVDLLPSVPDGEYPKKVIDAQHRFAKRRYEHEFKWRPSRKVEEAIVAALSGRQGKVSIIQILVELHLDNSVNSNYNLTYSHPVFCL